MWRHAESIILGFLCFFLPLFLVLWFLKLVIGIGDETFGWVGKLIFQREIYGFGLVLLLVVCWILGESFSLPFVGPLFTKIFVNIPYFGVIIQRRDIVSQLRSALKKSGCGPIYVPLYDKDILHPGAIVSVLLTDIGYRVVICIATIPPQELVYRDTVVVEYGLPASEMTAIHLSFGIAAKKTDLRGVWKQATIKELIEQHNLYKKLNGGKSK